MPKKYQAIRNGLSSRGYSLRFTKPRLQILTGS